MQANVVETADGLHSPSVVAAATEQALPPVSRLRRAATLAPLLALLLLWLGVFSVSGAFKDGPNGRALGGDFAILLSGSQVLKAGGNPYDHTLLYRTEASLLRRQGVLAPTSQPFIRVGNPPLLFWAMQPLTGLPFKSAAVGWVLSMYALVAAGFLAALRYFGWRNWLGPTLLFLAMPQTVLSAYYGNVDGLVFAAICFALALVKRYPFLAGALLGFAWLKPQVALPIVLLIALFHAPSRPRLISGFGSAAAALFLLTGLTAGWHSFSLWAGALTGYSHDTAVQPDLASLTGLYVYWAPPTLHLALQTLTIGLACALTAIWWWKVRATQRTAFMAGGWLWVVWFLAAPFGHFHDEILMAVPLLALLGRDGQNLSQLLPVLALYTMFLSVLLFPTARLHTDLQSLSLLPVGAFCFLAARPQVAESWS